MSRQDVAVDAVAPTVLTAPEVVVASHEVQLAENGGPAGTRDAGLLESTLVRAQNLEAYGNPDFADLAAAYGDGIAHNHPFVDGNKRTAFIAVELFLKINDIVLSRRTPSAY